MFNNKNYLFAGPRQCFHICSIDNWCFFLSNTTSWGAPITQSHSHCSDRNIVLKWTELNKMNQHKRTVETNHFILSLLHWFFDNKINALNDTDTHTPNTNFKMIFFTRVCPQSATTRHKVSACLTESFTVCLIRWTIPKRFAYVWN